VKLGSWPQTFAGPYPDDLINLEAGSGDAPMRSGLASLLVLLLAACGGSSPVRYVMGGRFDSSTPRACILDGNAISVQDGAGIVIATTTLHITNRGETGGTCTGQASWSVQVPKTDTYRIARETDQPVGMYVESDLISFAKLQAHGFTLHLTVRAPPDIERAHLIEVLP
jgi:hypothetical protein